MEQHHHILAGSNVNVVLSDSDTRPENPDSYQVMNGGGVRSMETLDKGRTPVPDGTAQDFITLLRMAHNLELMNRLFLEFSM